MRWKSLVLVLLLTLLPPAAEWLLLWPAWSEALPLPALAALAWPLAAVSLWLMLPRRSGRLGEVLLHGVTVLCALVWPVVVWRGYAPGLGCLWALAWAGLTALAAVRRFPRRRAAGLLLLPACAAAVAVAVLLGLSAAG